MAASVYPSAQWGEIERGRLPMFAASDIWANTIVRVASSGDWTVQMVATTTEQPLGIARDFAAAGQAITVYDVGNVQRVVAGASLSRQSEVHVVGTSSGTHPISGVTVTYPVAGQVTPGASSGAEQWSVGQAFESGAISDLVAVRINPRTLSGTGG